MKIIHKKLKVHSLTGRITPKIMEKAWKNVRKNRGAAGIDKISTQMFESNLEDNLHALMKSIKTRGTFRASPLKRVYTASCSKLEKCRTNWVKFYRLKIVIKARTPRSSFFWNFFGKKASNLLKEIDTGLVISIVYFCLSHYFPKTFDWIEIWTIGW